MATDPSDIRAPHLRSDDFLGAFAVVESDKGILMVQNRRVIGGRSVLTWDLPGGQVEPGETLVEALVRELREEVSIDVDGDVEGEPAFLFYQEGERLVGGRRRYMWRSFFFAVAGYRGEPRIGLDEVLAFQWMPRAAMRRELTAPYHDSFLEWLDHGGQSFACTWRE